MQAAPVPATLITRQATPTDIPFLARIQYEAALPPYNACFWDDILQDTPTRALPFIEAMLRAEACNWGNVANFWILEAQAKPVAAAAGYTPNPEDYCPLQLNRLSQIALDLGWSPQAATAFQACYLGFWGNHTQPPFLAPYAPWIIENVAVLPEARGQGYGKTLIRAMLSTARSQQLPHVGIMIVNGNEVARHTYEALGFRPYQAFYADYFRLQYGIEFAGVTKFVLPLGA